ncbi:5812_t:CDS:2, partial [Racocetra persica]
DVACRARCAHVPNPSNQDVNATNSCIAACPNNTTEAYQTCRDNCILQYYSQPTSYPQSAVAVAPTPTNPSAPSGTNANMSSTGKPTSTPNPISAASQFKSNLYFALFLAILAAAIL